MTLAPSTNPAPDNWEVEVTNTNRSLLGSGMTGGTNGPGGYSAAFVDQNNNAVVAQGDILSLQVLDDNNNNVGTPFSHQVTLTEVTDGAAIVDLSVSQLTDLRIEVEKPPGASPLVVGPTDTTSVVVGGQLKFNVTGLDGSGNPVSGLVGTFTWSIGNPSFGAFNDINSTGPLFTAGQTALSGSSTVRAVFDNSTPADLSDDFEETTEISLAPGPVNSATLSFANSTLVADGASQTSVTVQSFDSFLNPASGTSLPQISATLGSVSSPLQSGVGTYQATFTAGTQAGTADVTATINGASASGSITLDPGPPATLTVGGTPLEIPADGTSSIPLSMSVRDANGNGVPGLSLNLSADNGGSFPIFKDGGSGDYEATYIGSTVAGPARITASTDGVSGTLDVTLTPGPPDSLTLSADPTELIANGTSTSTLDMFLTDANNNPISGRAADISLSAGLSEISAVTEVAGEPGKYQATYTSGTTAGDATVTATIANITETATVSLVPGPVASITVALGVDTLVANGTEQTTATVTSADASGNLTSGENQAITTSLGTASGLAETAPGTNEATITAGNEAGTATVEVTIDGITESVSLTLLPNLAASIDIAVGSDTLVADGTAQTVVTAISTDVSGNPTSPIFRTP